MRKSSSVGASRLVTLPAVEVNPADPHAITNLGAGDLQPVYPVANLNQFFKIASTFG